MADNATISDADNSVLFSVQVKDKNGAPVAGVGVYAIIDGQTGNTPSSVTDGTGKTGFSLFLQINQRIPQQLKKPLWVFKIPSSIYLSYS